MKNRVSSVLHWRIFYPDVSIEKALRTVNMERVNKKSLLVLLLLLLIPSSQSLRTFVKWMEQDSNPVTHGET